MIEGRGERKEREGWLSRLTPYVLRFVLWATAVFLFWLVLRAVPLADTWAVLRQLAAWQLALLAVANGAVLLIMNGRWWLILHGQGYSVPYLILVSYRLAGAGLSYITPGPQFGGEPLQVLLIERNYGVPRPTAVATVTLDKTLELIVNFSFLVGGIVLAWQTRMLGEIAGWETAVLPLFLLLLPLSLLINFWHEWQWLTRLTQLPVRLLNATPWVNVGHRLLHGLEVSEKRLAHLCRQQPQVLILAFLISLLGWLALMAEFWLMLALLNIKVTFVQMVVILTAARVAILLPLPGGLGTLEASQLLTITTLGFEPATALSFSLLIRTRDVLLACLGLWIAKRALTTVPPS